MFAKSYYIGVPKVSFQDRHLYKVYDSTLIAIRIVWGDSFSKQLFLTQKLMLKINSASSTGGEGKREVF
jgi:hypothetical protein